MEKSQEVWVMLDHQKKNRTTSITEDVFKQRTASKQAVFLTCLPQAPVQHEIHTPDSLKKSPNNRFCLNYWKNGVHRAINLNYLAFTTIKPQNSTWLFSRANVITFCYAKILFQKWAKVNYTNHKLLTRSSRLCKRCYNAYPNQRAGGNFIPTEAPPRDTRHPASQNTQSSDTMRLERFI